MPLYTPTPDASSTVKGKLKLTGDLGGTADSPTTPTAVHITGDEAAEGVKYWSGDQHTQAKHYREGGLAVPGYYLGAFGTYGTTAAIFNDVSAKSTYIFQNDDFPNPTAPFYAKNEDTGEIVKVVSDGGYTWSACVRGEFGTSPAPVTIGDIFTLQATGDNVLYMDNTYERVLVDCTGGVLEVVLPDPNSYTLQDGDTFTIFDYTGSLGNGNALIVRDPVSGNTVEVWDAGAMVTAQFDTTGNLYNFQTIKSLASDYASPARYAVKVATTAALSVSSYSFPNLNLSSALFSIEGVTLRAGDPILVKDQATASQNGVYIYNTSTQLVRDPYFQTSQNYVPGMQFYVSEGIINADSVFILTTNDNVILDTSSLTFRRSGGVQTVVSRTANLTLTVADDGVIQSYTTLAAPRAVTLPALSAVPEGYKTIIIDSTTGTHANTNNLTIQRAGADTFVDGTTSKVINTANGGFDIVKLNNSWVAIQLTQDQIVSSGRGGGQTITGGTAASNKLILRSTSNATKGSVELDEAGGKTTLILSNTGSNTGMTIGGDTNLYREGANILATDDKLHVVGELELDGDLNHDGTNVGFFGVAPVARATELTDELATITHTAPGTPDYAIQDLTNIAPYGFASQDEGNTVLSVIANLQTRVKELEDKLTAYGLLQDAD